MFTARAGAVLLLAFLPAVVVAQDRVVQIGLVGGLNRSTMTGVGPVNAEFAGQAGLSAQFQLSSHVAFRPEVSVSWKRLGTSDLTFPTPCDPGPCPLIRLASQAVAYDQTTSLSWLEVPLLAQVSLPRLGSSITPRLIAGPYVALRLSCSVSSSTNFVYDLPGVVEPPGPVVSFSQGCDDASGGSYGNGDAGYVVGAGLATGRFGLGFRWTRSLVATVPFNQFSNSPLMGGKQSTLAIMVDVEIH